LTDEAKKARGVGRLARVQLTSPPATLQIAAAGAAARFRRREVKRRIRRGDAPSGGGGENPRGHNPRRAAAARTGVTAGRRGVAPRQESSSAAPGRFGTILRGGSGRSKAQESKRPERAGRLTGGSRL
jgi:hypothetical protein